VDGVAYTGLVVAAGSAIHGDITAGSSTNGAGLALYKRAV
jgi:hypothetical protein